MNLDKALSTAKKAALEAGKCIKDYYQNQKSYELTHKDKEQEQPLTSADTQANHILEKALRSPDTGWLSEESLEDLGRLEKEWVWIIDPMDGTKEFINQVPEFGVSIGLSYQGKAVLGVFYNPIKEDFFWGAKGQGVYHNNQKVEMRSSCPQLKDAKVLVSRSETKKGKWKIFDDDFHQIPTGSVAYKMALVGAGKADITFTLNPRNEWDICAGAFFIEEGGGVLLDGQGNPIHFNQKETLKHGVIACPQPLKEALFACIEKRRSSS